MHSFDLEGPYDLASTFFLFSMGSGDPCLKFDGPHQFRMALTTAAGRAAISVKHEDDQLHVEFLDTESHWLVEHLPVLFGLEYQPPEIRAPRALVTIANKYRGMRIQRYPYLSQRLVQIILQQLVTFRDACYGWRKLVTTYGTQVPDQPDLWYSPTSQELAKLVSHQFIECGVLPQHGRRIVETMRRSKRIESTWGAGLQSSAVQETTQLLAKLPGIGPWTIGYLQGAGMGNEDALMLGDYSHPRHVAQFFTGKAEGDDEDMVRFLEPYKPHRFYALTLILLGAPAPERRGPRRRSLRERFR